MVLRLVSLALVLPVVLANGYWASGLDRNLAYIAASAEVRCGMVGWLWPLGAVLPWTFLALGAAAALQLVFVGRFGLSVALLKLHLAHLALLQVLLVLGNGYCRGLSTWRAIWNLSELLVFGGIVMLLPVPILAMQIQAIRMDVSCKDGAL